MKFKEGDKVLFLNEKGGGIVTRVVDDEIVHVSIEEGFEIPYAVGDLISAGRSESNEKEDISGKTSRSPLMLLTHQASGVNEGLYLAMVPRNQEKVLNSPLDFYILNHTGLTVCFALFMNKSGHYSGIYNGTVEASSKQHIFKVERTEIEDWNNALFQAVFYKKGKTETLKPLSEHIVFKPVRIYKEESFAFSPLLNQKALNVTIWRRQDDN